MLLACAGSATGAPRAAGVAAAACSAVPGGSAAYPYYCEHGRPAGSPRGQVVVVHGGAWSGVGPAAVARLRPAARRFRRLGFETFNVDYATGTGGLESLLAIHALIRRSRHGPVCIYGASAGGHLALLAAARRRFACAIVEAAPATSSPRRERRRARPGSGTSRVSTSRGLPAAWRPGGRSRWQGRSPSGSS